MKSDTNAIIIVLAKNTRVTNKMGESTLYGVALHLRSTKLLQVYLSVLWILSCGSFYLLFIYLSYLVNSWRTWQLFRNLLLWISCELYPPSSLFEHSVEGGSFCETKYKYFSVELNANRVTTQSDAYILDGFDTVDRRRASSLSRNHFGII